MERAQVKSASRGRPGSRRHGLCGEAPYRSQKGEWSVRLDKSHIVRHNTGRCYGCGGPDTGNPARPRAGRFTSHNVFLSYGRGSTGRAVTPPAAPTSQLNEVRRGRNAAGVAGGSFVFSRVQRHGWFKAKTAISPTGNPPAVPEDSRSLTAPGVVAESVFREPLKVYERDRRCNRMKV
jgi:hypothetical protein